MKLTPDGLAAMVVDTVLKAVDGPRVGGRFARLEAELAEARAELAAVKATAYLKDAGIWRHGTTYVLGDVAQFSGSAWVCTKAHTAGGPTADHAYWRLWIKRGKDGKDAR